jgi:GTP-binding protein Era
MLIRDVTAQMGQGEKFVLELVKEAKRPTFLLLNKIDALTDRKAVLPLIAQYQHEYDFKEIIPISARKGENTDRLVNTLLEYLPIGPNHFPDDEITDRNTRAIVAEMVREKVLTTTEQELPFATAVIVEKWQEEERLTRIFCAIYVERDSQRAIVIGRGGQKLKQIGMQARQDIEHLLGKKVYLELFVKVQENWRNDERILDELGIEEKRKIKL